jgi:hypothetical protein
MAVAVRWPSRAHAPAPDLRLEYPADRSFCVFSNHEDIQTRATFIRTYDGRRVVIPMTSARHFAAGPNEPRPAPAPPNLPGPGPTHPVPKPGSAPSPTQPVGRRSRIDQIR